MNGNWRQSLEDVKLEPEEWSDEWLRQRSVAAAAQLAGWMKLTREEQFKEELRAATERAASNVGGTVGVPPIVAEEMAKFMRGEPSLFLGIFAEWAKPA